MKLKDYEELLVQRHRLQQQLQPIQEKIAAYEADVLKQFKAGESPENFIRKKGRITRSILKEKELVASLTKAGVKRSDCYVVKLAGVPALEKLVKATFDPKKAETLLTKHVQSKAGNPTVEYVGTFDE